ncbi:MAG: hypothetical protein A2V73_08200, partial [candidate division Zixibacteria bacterium RBG_19FT_COMBO_42_43]
MPKDIVVLGAGYAGINCVIRLNKLLKKNPDYQIHLMDRNPYHLLETRLHEAAARQAEITIPIAAIIHKRNIIFHLTEVIRINLNERKVITLDKDIYYDYLVIALGSKTNFYDIPGLKDYAFQLKTFDDTYKIRDNLKRAFAKAKSEKSPEERKKLLTIVIGGGGLTGVELAAEIAELVEELSHKWEIPPQEPQIYLIEAGETILPAVEKKIIDKAKENLIQKKVKISTSTKVVKMESGEVFIEPGGKIPAYTLIWTGGIRISSILKASGLEVGPLGRIKVNQFLEVENFSNVYAVGDNALAVNPKTGKFVPCAAQFALQQGRLVANNIYAKINGKPQKPYRQKVLGEVISL